MKDEQWAAVIGEEEVRGVIVGGNWTLRKFIVRQNVGGQMMTTHTIRDIDSQTDDEAIERFRTEYPDLYAIGAEMRVYE